MHDLIDFHFLWLSFYLQHFQVVNHPLDSPNHQFYSIIFFLHFHNFIKVILPILYFLFLIHSISPEISYFSFVSLSPFLLFSIHNFIQFLSFFIHLSIFCSPVFQWFLPDSLFLHLEQISGFPFLLFLCPMFLFLNPIFESMLLITFVGLKSFEWFILFGLTCLRILFASLYCLPVAVKSFVKDLKNQNWEPWACFEYFHFQRSTWLSVWQDLHFQFANFWFSLREIVRVLIKTVFVLVH